MLAARRKRILITGATDGIGLALAERLAPRHDLLLTGRRAVSADALPQGAHYVVADQADPQNAARNSVAAIRDAGWTGLDHAVLNAGTGFQAENGVDSIAHLRATLDVNLAANIALAHALHPFLAACNGTLSFVGSVAHKGSALFPAYAASKGGLHAFARALRSEWQGQVSVQILHPGPTATGMHEKAGHDPGRLRAMFTSAGQMAAMLETALATGKSPVTLSFFRRASHQFLPEKRL
jgi:3-oxoacyl-[acyl-carrier protein] reductase